MRKGFRLVISREHIGETTTGRIEGDCLESLVQKKRENWRGRGVKHRGCMNVGNTTRQRLEHLQMGERAGNNGLIRRGKGWKR